jgi:cytochrome c biogenesis protein
VTTERSLPQSVWDYLCSLKLAMLLLLSLAITSIIGTIIPQGNLDPQYLQTLSQAKFKLYTALGFFDMYHSWWFVLLLMLLAVNLTACSIKRLPQIWKVVTQPVTTLDDGLRKSLANLETIKVAGSAQSLKDRVAQVLQGTVGTPVITEKDGAYHIFAQKTPWCRLAVYVVHLSILVIFLGAIVGSLFGFKGYVNIPERGSVNKVMGRNNKPLDLGFELRCEKFSVAFYDTGAPKEFKSILTVLENGKPVPGFVNVATIVNDPLTYKGMTFYQSSYGNAGEHDFVVSNLDGSNPSGVKVPSDSEASLPGGAVMHVLEAVPEVSPYEPDKTGPAAFIEIHTTDGGSHKMVIYANYPELNLALAKKSGVPYLFKYVGGREGKYTGLQVTRDPGVNIVWLGCLLMVIGVYCAFFLSHKRVWAVVKDGEIVIGGNANKNPAGFQIAFEQLVDRVKGGTAQGEGK